MPAKGITEGANITDFIENCFPVFYLKYIDDLGDKSDTKETIATLIDVILTFTGVGNIAKLRHVKDLSLVRKLFMAGELSTIERVALTRALSGLASGAEAIIGVASLVHRFATAGCTIYYNNEQNPPELNDPEYQKYKLCQSIDIWLFALEMLSLSGDLLARRAFRRATKKLQQSIPSGNEYSELRTAVNSLDELDSLLIDWLSSIQESHPNVYSKVITFTDDEKKLAFMLDFENISKLDALNENNLLIERWNQLLERGIIEERRSINFLKEASLTETIIKYYDETNLKNILTKIDIVSRRKFLEEFKSLTNIEFEKIINNPNKLELIIDYQKNIKLGQYDGFAKEDILEIINSNLNYIQIGLLRIKTTTIVSYFNKRFGQDINNINISSQRLQDIQSGSFFSFFNNLNSYQRKKFKSSNKLLIELQSFNGTVPSSEKIIEHYLSGDKIWISKTFPNNNPGSFIEPTNYTKFEIFNKKAIQVTGRERNYDTELKFIFNFLENHWNKGNRFVINIESTLYACNSCQSYFIYLKELARKEGKILEINFYSKVHIKSIKEAKSIK